MAQISPAFPHHVTGTIELGRTEFESFLDSEQAAAMPGLHPKTRQKMARRSELAPRQGTALNYVFSDAVNSEVLLNPLAVNDHPAEPSELSR